MRFWLRSLVRRGSNLARLAAFVGVLPAICAAATQTTITVWDFKSGDPTLSEYFDQSIRDFEASHPGVTVKHVSQPHAQYYALLGTAMGANSGPDIVLLHGGSETSERSNFLVPLDASVGELKNKLVGWEAFSGTNGSVYAIPITLQGQVIYFNKDLFRKAGLDPDRPPATWSELNADCAQIIARARVACFALGNKEGYGAMFFVNAFAANSWTNQQQVDWANRKLTWSDPPVSKLLRLFVETKDAGWYARGINSTSMFPDQYEQFMRGEAANVIGLISDTAHWKQFEEFMGAGKVGSYLPVSVPLNDQRSSLNDNMGLPIAGGIGWAVTRWSPHKDLAIAYAKSMASPAHLHTLFEVSGAIVSDGQYGQETVKSPNGKRVLDWVACCRKPMAQNAFGLIEMQEFERDSQRLTDGSMTVQAVVSRLDKLRAPPK